MIYFEHLHDLYNLSEQNITSMKNLCYVKGYDNERTDAMVEWCQKTFLNELKNYAKMLTDEQAIEFYQQLREVNGYMLDAAYKYWLYDKMIDALDETMSNVAKSALALLS